MAALVAGLVMDWPLVSSKTAVQFEPSTYSRITREMLEDHFNLFGTSPFEVVHQKN